MKILFFANTDWYLYRFRLGLARALHAQGHEVVLVSPAGRHADKLQEAGFRWVRFEFSRSGVNVLAESLVLARLVDLYRRERPDLVHHFTIKCVLYGSFSARVTGVRAIVNSITGMGHVFTASGWQAGVLRWLVTRLYRRMLAGTRVIFENPDDLAAFSTLGLVSNAQAHVIRGVGVDTVRYRPTPGSKGRRVLLAARLLWTKGVAEYLEAALEVKKSMPNVTFLLAGERDPGNPASMPQAAINALRARGEVELLGHCDDMASLLGSVDLAVLPSYREGTPTALLEAAACGLPLVASDVPGCREVVREGVNGYLVPARDSRQLAQAIVTLLLDDGLRVRMGHNSRIIVCREFAREKIDQDTLEVYQKIQTC